MKGYQILIGVAVAFCTTSASAITFVGGSGPGKTIAPKGTIVEIAKTDPLIIGEGKGAFLDRFNMETAEYGGVEGMAAAAKDGDKAAQFYLAEAEVEGIKVPWKGAPLQTFYNVSAAPASTKVSAIAAWLMYLAISEPENAPAGFAQLRLPAGADQTFSRKALEKAAAAGVPQAQYRLGRYLEQGAWGLPHSVGASIVLYSRSAASGFNPAMARLKTVQKGFLDVKKIQKIRTLLAAGNAKGLRELRAIYSGGDGWPASAGQQASLSQALQVLSAGQASEAQVAGTP